jgi:hypothetical protein
MILFDERRQKIHELAETARAIEQEIRPNEDIGGETWVEADWLADELEALDWEMAREA